MPGIIHIVGARPNFIKAAPDRVVVYGDVNLNLIHISGPTSPAPFSGM